MALTLETKAIPAVNAAQSGKTIGTRFPADMIALLDAVSARRGDKDRAATIHHAVVQLIEAHFPGSTSEARLTP